MHGVLSRKSGQIFLTPTDTREASSPINLGPQTSRRDGNQFFGREQRREVIMNVRLHSGDAFRADADPSVFIPPEGMMSTVIARREEIEGKKNAIHSNSAKVVRGKLAPQVLASQVNVFLQRDDLRPSDREKVFQILLAMKEDKRPVHGFPEEEQQESQPVITVTDLRRAMSSSEESERPLVAVIGRVLQLNGFSEQVVPFLRKVATVHMQRIQKKPLDASREVLSEAAGILAEVNTGEAKDLLLGMASRVFDLYKNGKGTTGDGRSDLTLLFGEITCALSIAVWKQGQPFDFIPADRMNDLKALIDSWKKEKDFPINVKSYLIMIQGFLT